jgi:Lantibiotic biosynthesis dehydratase C-term
MNERPIDPDVGRESRDAGLGLQADACSTPALSPDPSVTAAAYCSGRLDEAICHLAAPFWRELRSLGLPGRPFFWLVRHWRRGEHLKLRVHAPAGASEVARDILAGAAAAYFDRLATQPSRTTRQMTPGREELLLIDPEDRAPGTAPDRSLVWTRYRRSPVLLGDEALLADDGYVTHIVRCFGAACEVTLEGLRMDGEAPPPHGARQSLLLRAVAAGLSAAFPEASARHAYLAFHRDWIVRYPVLFARRGSAKAEEILALLDRGVSQLGNAALAQVGEMMVQASTANCPDAGTGNCHAAWRRSLADLRTYLAAIDDVPYFASDPFAEGPLFPALFKVFHQLANQLGVKTLDEGLAYHLLLRATEAPAKSHAFLLLPRSVGEIASAEEDATDNPAHPLDASYPWNQLVSLASSAGRDWVGRFLEQHQDPIDATNEALRLLRATDLGDDRLSRAAALLERAGQQTRGLAASDPPAYGVFGRFYFGTLAYLRYCNDELDLAPTLLDRANACLIAAVSEQRCLLPATPLNADIPLQKARIARRRRRWQEMALHLGELHQMQADERPLCLLGDGTAVYYRTLGQVFDAAGTLTPDQQTAIRNLLDKSQRLRAVSRRVRQLYTPSHLLIWYR